MSKLQSIAQAFSQSINRLFKSHDYQTLNDKPYYYKKKMLSHIYTYILYQPKLTPKKRLSAPPQLVLTADQDINRQRIQDYNKAVVSIDSDRRIEHCQIVKQYNRKYLASATCALQNRLRVNGFCWGLFWGTLLTNTLMRKSNRIRKTAALLSLGQAGSELAVYRNIDVLYDRMIGFVENQIQTIKQEHGWIKKSQPVE